MGMVGLYVGRIYDEVRARPLYVVRETHGFGETAGRFIWEPADVQARNGREATVDGHGK